ncbi:MAG TPA: universal stress protein [Bryobacteraceae bacterium]|jgi:nucleotide-binding universal stress UspA family protein|nr:universal stress protein [Bryobacteraceae bacterium]
MLHLKQIVLPVDFSPRSERAARYAQVVASRFHSHIVLLHVEHEPPFIGGEEVGAPPPGSIDHKLWLRGRLNAFMRSELREPAVTRVLLEGDPAAQIVELARSNQDGLIMMATSGHGAFRQFLLRSTLARVIQHSACPVCTGLHFAEGGSAPPLVFRKVACAIDLGSHSRSALEWASQFSAAFGARLLVIHVVRPSGGQRTAPGNPQSETIERANVAIAGILDNLGIQADVAVASGRAPSVVHDLAQGSAADILVIGRCALSGRLHPDTYGIIQQSHCPVVSV